MNIYHHAKPINFSGGDSKIVSSIDIVRSFMTHLNQLYYLLVVLG